MKWVYSNCNHQNNLLGKIILIFSIILLTQIAIVLSKGSQFFYVLGHLNFIRKAFLFNPYLNIRGKRLYPFWGNCVSCILFIHLFFYKRRYLTNAFGKICKKTKASRLDMWTYWMYAFLRILSIYCCKHP